MTNPISFPWELEHRGGTEWTIQAGETLLFIDAASNRESTDQMLDVIIKSPDMYKLLTEINKSNALKEENSELKKMVVELLNHIDGK